ncbi:MAG: acyltransferase domain-containing protein, partial [Myxococcales bacterium]|nr:acyltransferase domain-containing protein [Myxococcales bacterium]
KRLAVDYAFHGPQMDPVQAELRAALGELALEPGSLSIFSTVTGGGVEGTQLDPAYWARGVRQPVRLLDAVEAATRAGYGRFVEVGPHPVLCADLVASLRDGAGSAVATLRRDRPGRAELLHTLAHLHVMGQPVDFEALGRGRVVPLPRYPFAPVEHWLGAEARPVVPAEPSFTPVVSTASLESRVDVIARGVLGIADSAPLSPRQGLFDLGMDSMMAMELYRRLQSELGVELVPTAVFEHPTIEQLAAHLAGIAPAVRRQASVAGNEPIAIVGMACRFPGGANDPEAFWSRLLEAFDGTCPPPADRWDEAAFYDPDPAAVGTMYARRSGFLQGVDVAEFDAPFFRISPAEAKGIDPQQRLLLELAWEALEDAGQSADRLEGSHTSVYVGLATGDYAQLCLQGSVAEIDPYMTTGNAPNTAAGRISHFLGLRGPAVALDTACSSSLVAAHLGCQSLRRGESDLSIIGGANLILVPVVNVLYARMGTLAPDSRCKAFDAAADGMVRGEGAGMVVLKRLTDAHRDGDRVLAVIRGSAINHDGRSSGLTVPSGAAQRAVVRAALHDAGVEPGAVGFVETHGTGTSLGDPIEANALVAELGRGRERPLWLGAAKASFGHLEAASGVLGLIKAVMTLRNGLIPPQRNFSALNPAIVPGDVPLRVPTEPTPWTEEPRIAGVSAFGVSGTNAHVILERAEPSPTPAAPTTEAGEATEALVLPISARDPEALRALARSHLERIGPDARTLCAAAALRRAHHDHRVAITGSSPEDLRAGLTAWLDGTLHPGWAAGHAVSSPRVVFVFSGHGSHWVGMGRDLLREPAFAATIAACEAVARRPFTEDLTADDAQARWIDPEILHPLVLALQLGLAAQWRAWGV